MRFGNGESGRGLALRQNRNEAPLHGKPCGEITREGY